MWYYQKKKDDSDVIDKLTSLAETCFDECYNKDPLRRLKMEHEARIKGLLKYEA